MKTLIALLLAFASLPLTSAHADVVTGNGMASNAALACAAAKGHASRLASNNGRVYETGRCVCAADANGRDHHCTADAYYRRYGADRQTTAPTYQPPVYQPHVYQPNGYAPDQPQDRLLPGVR